MPLVADAPAGAVILAHAHLRAVLARIKGIALAVSAWRALRLEDAHAPAPAAVRTLGGISLAAAQERLRRQAPLARSPGETGGAFAASADAEPVEVAIGRASALVGAAGATKPCGADARGADPRELETDAAAGTIVRTLCDRGGCGRSLGARRTAPASSADAGGSLRLELADAVAGTVEGAGIESEAVGATVAGEAAADAPVANARAVTIVGACREKRAPSDHVAAVGRQRAGGTNAPAALTDAVS